MLGREELSRYSRQIMIREIGEETITGANVKKLVDGSDLIVDVMDNLPTRYLLNKAALGQNAPFFHIDYWPMMG